MYCIIAFNIVYQTMVTIATAYFVTQIRKDFNYWKNQCCVKNMCITLYNMYITFIHISLRLRSIYLSFF